jgi:Protein of unknown function (DUF4238)
MSKVARNHHFVPQCYLAGFTDKRTKQGRLWVCDFTARRVFQQRPKNVAFEVDFNRFETTNGHADELERAFGEFERHVASVIVQIVTTGLMPPDDKLSYLVNFITLLAVRHPAMRESMDRARKRLYRVIGDMLASDEQLFRSQIQRAHDSGFVRSNNFPFSRFRDFVRRGEYVITIPREDHIQRELKVFDKLLADVGNRHWSLIVAAEDAPDFITCDRPSSLVYRQLVFPLTARFALLADKERPWREHITADTRGVAELNSRLLHIAQRQIYSRTSRIALLDGDAAVFVPLSRFVEQ